MAYQTILLNTLRVNKYINWHFTQNLLVISMINNASANIIYVYNTGFCEALVIINMPYISGEPYQALHLKKNYHCGDFKIITANSVYMQISYVFLNVQYIYPKFLATIRFPFQIRVLSIQFL